MINDEEFKKKLREVHPGTYDRTMPEMQAIYRISNNDYFFAICYAFKFGFLKGQRAATAKERMKRKNAKAKMSKQNREGIKI